MPAIRTQPLEYQQLAVERTLRWAEQCVEAHAGRTISRCSASCKAGRIESLRAHCAEELIAMDFPGYAIGGLAVGEGFDAMKRVLDARRPLLPEHKPRYLMGVGFPRDIVAAVAQGVDMFDCVLPTRNGRNAYAFTADGAIRLRNSQFIAAIPDRSKRAATATPAGPLRAGRSGTFFSRARCLARSWFPCIIFGSTNG